MTSSKILSFFHSILEKYKKQGFTLAEALIITVMAGVCLMPILGTMQNAQVRTENYDHQSKMQLYTRSRLTAEIANAAFDHKSVNLEDEYHYIVYFATGTADDPGSEEDARLMELARTYVTLEDLASLTSDPNHNNWATAAIDLFGLNKSDKEPYLQIVHAYKTSVETQYNFKLATFSASVDDGEGDGDGDEEEQAFASPKGLLAIVVKTCLIKSNGNDYDPSDGALITEYNADGSIKTTDKENSVLPVTLFSMANLPTVSDEFIWMVDKHNNKVIGIDPLSKTKSSEITFDKGPDNEPLHIAVHPSGKILAVQCKKKIYLVNIDVKSPFKDSKKIILEQTEEYADKDHGGIAFRPDGKVLYYTNKGYKETEKEPSLLLRGFNYQITDNVLEWSDEETEKPTVRSTPRGRINFKNYGEQFTNIVAANDGYLYVGGGAYSEGGPGGPAKDIKVVFKYPMYSSFVDGQICKCIQILKTDYEIQNLDVSSDGQFLLCIPKGPGDKTVEIYDTKTQNLVKSITTGQEITKGIFVSYSNKNLSFKDASLFVALSGKKGTPKKASIEIYALNDKTWHDLENSNLEDNGSIIASPIDGKLVFNSKYKNKGTDINKLFISDFLYESENHELTDEEATVLEEKKTGPAPDIKSEFAASERDVMAFSSNKKIKLLNLNTLKQIDDAELNAPETLKGITMNPTGDMLLGYYGTIRSGYTRFHLNSLDDEDDTVPAQSSKFVFDDQVPNIAFSLEDRGDTSNTDAFWGLYQDDSDWETEYGTAYDRRDYNLNTDWKRYNLIGMPNGGAMVLYGKPNGSSMLEWIGRRNWGSKKGKYRLFARWTNISESEFPELTIPSAYEADSIAGESDNWKGRIHVLKYETFPVNSTVTKIKYAKAANDFSGTKYITPVIVEYTDSSMQQIRIKDYALESISFTPDSSQSNVEINWKNGGKILNSNYRVGFWNGDITSASDGYNDGPINYIKKTSGDFGTDGYVFLSDYYMSTVSDSNKSSDTYAAVTRSQIESLSHTYKEFSDNISNGKNRKYSISFCSSKLSFSFFPPLGSKIMAISPDCGTLAILATNTSNIPIVNLYDFNNNIYGPETQIEGMLIDYREMYDSNKNNSSWPDEKEENFFKSVFSGCSIASTSDFISKYDSMISFNKYPANYKIYSDTSWDSTKKQYANKRFVGYYRPENNIAKMLVYYNDEPRIFFDNSFIFGSKEPGSISSTTMGLLINNFSKGLLQIDHASNGNAINLGIFFSSSNTANPPSSISPVDSYYPIHFETSDSKWLPLLSDYSYILNNHPTFMGSFVAKTGSTQLDYSNTSMVFSRDKAKPVLYFNGTTYLWALYKNTLIRTTQSNNYPIKTNIALSTDGQKLIFGRSQSGTTNNYISVFNISNPDEDRFTSTDITTTSKNFSDFSNSYLNLIKDISVDSIPNYLATKPFTSYKSSDIGGSYKYLTSSSTFRIAANAATVASGGIYLIRTDKNDIALYNPMTNYLEVNGYSKKQMNSSAVTSYDETLYMFGNSGTGEPISNRVQSYDINTGISKSSDIRSGDTYRANIYYSSDSSSYVNTGCEPNDVGGNSSNAFDGQDDTCWSTGIDVLDSDTWGNHSSGWIRYKYTSNTPFVVNKIRVNNESYRLGFYDGTKEFAFYGLKDDDTKVFLASGTLTTPYTTKEYPFYNNIPFKRYRFESLSTHDSGTDKQVGLAELTMYRTDLVRLTPISTSQIIDKNNTNYYMNYSTSKVASATIIWSTPSGSSYNFGDIIGNIGSIYNNYEGGGSQGWQSTAANPYLTVSFEEPEILRFLRYSNGDTSGFASVSTIQIKGSNEKELPTTTSSSWEDVITLSSLPNIKKYWIPCEISNYKKYKHYLFTFSYSGTTFRITGFELYGEPNTGDTLTPMLTDTLGGVNVGNTAACSTPYGLITSGGYNGSIATTTTLLYWPHAINRYDGQSYQQGISRSLPLMNCEKMNHCLVWHKGKLYSIGGRKKESGSDLVDSSNFIECLDFDKNLAWESVTLLTNMNDPDFDVADKLLRYNHGACSFGDEIFIFGGQNGDSSYLSDAYAWNPDTGDFRELNPIRDSRDNSIKTLSPCCAVPYGSKIYVIGMNSSKLYIMEYTP